MPRNFDDTCQNAVGIPDQNSGLTRLVAHDECVLAALRVEGLGAGGVCECVWGRGQQLVTLGLDVFHQQAGHFPPLHNAAQSLLQQHTLGLRHSRGQQKAMSEQCQSNEGID